MPDRSQDLARGRPPSDGWTIASLVIVLGVALAWRYLVPRSGEPPVTSPRSHIRGIEAADVRGHGHRTTSPSEVPVRNCRLREHIEAPDHGACRGHDLL